MFGRMGSLKESKLQVTWAAAMEKDENSTDQSFESSSITDSETSFSEDDESSSSTSPNSCGPLYELAELMAQLPIKRGLSKYYHGKSQTFASLSSVRNVEDLAKKESSYSRRMKSCKSYGANLNRHKFSPKATIAKRMSTTTSPKGSFSPSRTIRGTTMVVN